MKTIREEISEYYGALIDAEIEAAFAEAEKAPIVPSKRFERRMRALLRRGGKAAPSRTKRILIIAAAALLALAMGACAVPEVRESIAGFFVKIFGDHVEYSVPDTIKERIEEEYGLVPIPEGFKLISQNCNENFLGSVYSDADGNILMLRQFAEKDTLHAVDNENGDTCECEIGGKTVLFYHSENSSSATWIEDGYFFSLSCGSKVDPEVFKEWIRAVKPK